MIRALILSGILLALTAVPALFQIAYERPGAARGPVQHGLFARPGDHRAVVSSDGSGHYSPCADQTFTTASGAATLAAYDSTTADNASTFASTVVVGGVTHQVYQSAILNINIGYNIYLPPEYTNNPSQRFPVLYFLHGQNGDENSSPNQIVATVNSATNTQPMIIVFVNGGKNSKYMDPLPGSKLNCVWMAEHTIINELIPTIDATYRTVAGKQGRTIQGFSMGGMGALRLAFKYPNLFSSVYSFAPAADDNASNVASNEPMLLAQMFNGSATPFAANEPQNEASANPGSINGLPIHITIGSADSLLSTAQGIDTLLTSLGITHDPLEIISGIAHDLAGLQAMTKSTSYQFASRNFTVSGELTSVSGK
jgi:enterochelin esterase-like enzyme